MYSRYEFSSKLHLWNKKKFLTSHTVVLFKYLNKYLRVFYAPILRVFIHLGIICLFQLPERIRYGHVYDFIIPFITW